MQKARDKCKHMRQPKSRRRASGSSGGGQSRAGGPVPCWRSQTSVINIHFAVSVQKNVYVEKEGGGFEMVACNARRVAASSSVLARKRAGDRGGGGGGGVKLLEKLIKLRDGVDAHVY